MIGRMTINHFSQFGTSESAKEHPKKDSSRTRAILVIAGINAKTPESVDSGVFRANPYNQMGNGSGLGCIGSPQATRRRMIFTLRCPLQVRCGRSSSRPSLPSGGVPGELPAERFRRMLASGEAGSMAGVARIVGCTRAYVSKVLRASPTGAPRG